MPKNPADRIKGKVASYSESVKSGIVIGDDLRTYLFTRKEWLAELPPSIDHDVSFYPDREWAKSITLASVEQAT